MSTKAMTPDEKAAIRDRLELLAAANSGVLTPDAVVADARKKDSPLHACFEWDVKKAAAEYWLIQARELIRTVRVTVNTETSNVTAVAYVRDPRQAHDAQGYVAVSSIRNDSDLAREVLVSEFSRVASMLRRARELAEVLGARDEVENLLTQVVGLRDRFEVEAPAARQ